MGNNFDENAASWDENPRRLQLVENVWNIIERKLPISSKSKVLDYGCGTGLLGYKLIEKVNSVCFCDTSAKMLEQVEKKRDFYGYENVNTLFADFSTEYSHIDKYDLIVSMLVLHHVEEIEKLIVIFNEILNENGHFCWIDLDKEDGSFHDDNTGIHHFGFGKNEIEKLLQKNGFEIKFYSTELSIPKEKEDGWKEYPLFICIAQKQ